MYSQVPLRKHILRFLEFLAAEPFFITVSPFDMVKDVHDFEELYYIPPFLSLTQASSSPYAEYCRALQYRLSQVRIPHWQRKL